MSDGPTISAAIGPEPTLESPRLSSEELSARAERYPLGAALDREALEDGRSAEVWHALREREPLTWCPALEGWLVTDRAWATELYRAPERFTVFTSGNLVRRSLGEQMLASDGERHEVQRKPFDPPFKARPVHENFHDVVAEQVRRALAEIADLEVFDVGVWASRFAVSTVGAVLGLGEKRPEELRGLYDAYAAAMEYGVPDEAERLAAAATARARFAELLTEDLRRVRAQPDGSLLARLAHTSEGLALDDHGIIQNVRLILFGAIETVESMVSNTLWLLLTEPDTLAQVRADRTLVANAVEEALRLIPPVGFADRYAAIDLEFHGEQLHAGEMILPVIIATNRDPAVFADPDRFDVGRANARAHHSFSHGKHFCLGANLARQEGELLIGGVLDAFPDMVLGEPIGHPVGFEFRRVTPVLLRPRG